MPLADLYSPNIRGSSRADGPCGLCFEAVASGSSCGIAFYSAGTNSIPLIEIQLLHE